MREIKKEKDKHTERRGRNGEEMVEEEYEWGSRENDGGTDGKGNDLEVSCLWKWAQRQIREDKLLADEER